jgi:hypothetical protein
MTMGTRTGKGNGGGWGPPYQNAPAPLPESQSPPYPWCRCRWGAGGVPVRRSGEPGGGEQAAGSGGAACWRAWMVPRSTALGALKEASHNIHYDTSIHYAGQSGHYIYVYARGRRRQGGARPLRRGAGVPLRRGAVAPLRRGAGRRYAGAQERAIRQGGTGQGGHALIPTASPCAYIRV